MDKTLKTMIENFQKNTGRSLEEWVGIVREKSFDKHGQIVKFLKEEHGFTHGFANLVAHKARESGSAGSKDQEELITMQYKGKEHFKPLFDKLMESITQFGKDVELAPKKAYVSLRRKKQFATLKPATKKRFEVGINLRGQEPTGKLVEEKPNAMCSHRIDLSGENDLSKEVFEWLRKAYENAG